MCMPAVLAFDIWSSFFLEFDELQSASCSAPARVSYQTYTVHEVVGRVNRKQSMQERKTQKSKHI